MQQKSPRQIHDRKNEKRTQNGVHKIIAKKSIHIDTWNMTLGVPRADMNRPKRESLCARSCVKACNLF